MTAIITPTDIPAATIKKCCTSKLYTHTGETVQADSPAFQGPWTLPETPGTTSPRVEF